MIISKRRKLIATSAPTQNLVTVTATFTGTPVNPTATFANLFADKRVGIMFQKDDGYVDDYTVAFKVINGGVVSGTTYPGIKYNDGTGKLLNVGYGFAINAASQEAWNSSLTSWAQYNEMLKSDNIAIINHSYQHNTDNGAEYQVTQNKDVILARTGYSTRVGVIPANLPGFTGPFVAHDHLMVSSEGFGSNNINAAPYDTEVQYGSFIYNNLNAAPYHAERMIGSRINMDSMFVSGIASAKTTIDFLFSEANTHGKSIFTLFSHDIIASKATYLNQIFDYIINHPSNSGGNEVWFGNSQDVVEYFETKRLAVKSTPVVNGNSMTFTIDLSNLPSANGKQNMSLKITGGTLSNVNVNGVDDYTYNTTTGLVNLYKKKANGNDVDPFLLSGNEANRVSGNVPLTFADVYNLNNGGELTDMIDGNTATGNYGNGSVLDVQETYFNVKKYNVKLNNLRIFNSNAGDYGIDAEWYYVPKGKFQKDRVLIATNRGTPLSSWVDLNSQNANVPISWIIRKGPTYLPMEIQIQGSYIPYSGTYAAKTKATLGKQLGINGFVWDFENPNDTTQVETAKLNNAKIFKGGVRFYLDGGTFEADTEKYTFDPTSSGFWKYDLLAQTCKTEGIEALFCIRGQSKPIQLTYPVNDRNGEKVPMPFGADKSLPVSYIAHAKWAFQNALRYGSGKNSDNTDRKPYLTTKAKVMTANGVDGSGNPVYHSTDNIDYYSLNTVKVGLNTLSYMECDNERDKWWMGEQGYQTGREYAAHLSAFYDGHQGTLGAGVGVKDADPFMKVVMMGTASPSVQYLLGMIDWCAENRGYKTVNGVIQTDANGHAVIDLPFDVINFHVYINDSTSQRSGFRGMPPELSSYSSVIDKWVSIATKYNKEVWCSEIGYDTGYGSIQRAARIVDITSPVVDGDSQNAINTKLELDNTTPKQTLRLKTQADWNLRAALIGWVKGLDRMMFYWIKDTTIDNFTIFSSCSFINQDNSKKPSAYYFEQVGIFANYTAVSTLGTDPYVVKGNNGSNDLYACWIPDEIGRTGTYNIPFTAGTSITLYTLSTGSTTPTTQNITTTGTFYTVAVSETPVFIKVN